MLYSPLLWRIKPKYNWVKLLSPGETMSDKYKVVINHEEQYSILPVGQALRRGQREVGVEGGGEECLRHIEEVWTDMRPADRIRLRREIGQ